MADIETENNLTDRLKIVSKKNTYEIVLEQLKSLIISGDIRPGEKLPGERVLADKFKVSRTSVRMALKLLEFMNLVEIRHGSGIVVTSQQVLNKASIHFEWMEILKQHPLMDLIEARKGFEPYMAELAAKNATEEDIIAMEMDLKDMESTIKSKDHGIKQASFFHELIFRSSKNIILNQIGLMLKNLMNESKKVSMTRRASASQSLREHREIFDAIKQHNQELANKKMYQHLINVEKNLKKTGIFYLD